MRESCVRAQLYKERPAPSTKTADNFSTTEKAAIAAALQARVLPSDDALLEKLLRHYVLTTMILVARKRVTVAGVSPFTIGSGKGEWPVGNTPTHILQAAVNNIANTHATYNLILPYVEAWEQTFHDFVFGTGGAKKLQLPCPSESCATPRLPAPRALHPVPHVLLIPAANRVRPGTTLHTSRQPPTCRQGATRPLGDGGGGDPKPDSEEARLGREAEPHEHRRVRRQGREGQKKEDQEGDEARYTDSQTHGAREETRPKQRLRRDD